MRSPATICFCAIIFAGINFRDAVGDDSLPTGAIARLKSAVSDKGRLVTSVAFSPDGKLLASGGYFPHAISLWDVATGKELRTCNGHTNGLGLFVSSPDGARLASASKDGTIRLWDVTTGKEVWSAVADKDRVFVVQFSPDGKTLTSGGADGVIRRWDAATGKETQT